MPRRVVPTRKLNTKLMDHGGRLDKKYKTSGKKQSRLDKKIVNRLLSILGIFLVLIGLFFGYQIYIKQQQFNSEMDSVVKRLDESFCKSFNKNLINTFLEIDVDDDENVLNAVIYLFSNDLQYGLNVTNYQFSIDNLGTQGTLKDLVKTNNLFLDKKSVFKYLSGYFYKEFNIKLDSVVISKKNYPLNDYFKMRSYGFLQKYFYKGFSIKNFSFYTDLCVNDFNSMLSSFYSSSLNINTYDYSSNFTVNSLFGMDEVKKEQIRIQILNSSGVEQWGFFIQKLFKSYGLNIVKVDSTQIPVRNTQISIDKEDIKSGNTLKLLRYLLMVNIEDKDIKNQENIYSDIYIILGQDSVV